MNLQRLIKPTFFVVVLFLFSKTFAQEGSPILSHYQESRETKNQNWAITQDNNNTMLFANRRGVISYDGLEWNTLSLPVIPFALATNPNDGRVYVGGENDYGFIEKDRKGIYEYFSLSTDSAISGMITKIIFSDSTIYFYCDKAVYCHNSNNLSLVTTLNSGNLNYYTGIFSIGDNIFINISEKGLHRVENNAVVPIANSYITINNEILFGLPYSENMVLIGTDDNKLSLFDGSKYHNFNLKDEGYIANSILSEGMCTSDSLYVFTTLIGGAVVVEKYSGSVLYTLNYQNGLPDDEIFAVGKDSDNGLWLSHAYGLSRADLNLPINNFSIYPGLQGNLTTSLSYKNDLYVGTSEGVFYLSQVKNYAEAEVLVKINSENLIANSATEKNNAPQSVEAEAPRKGILAKLFGKRNTTENEASAPPPPVNTPGSANNVINNTTQQFEKKTITTLKSIDYLFRKIDGVNGKCKQLVATENGILVATNMGLFHIANQKGSAIKTGDYINYISSVTVEGKYYAGTNRGLLSLVYGPGGWKANEVISGFSGPVYSIANTEGKSIWIGSDDKALRYDLASGFISEQPQSYNIKTDFPQQYYVQYLNDTLYMMMESGMYYFNETQSEFIQYNPDVINLKSGFSFLITEPESPWIKVNNNWKFLKSDKSFTMKEEALFRIFDQIQSISFDNKNLWVIDGNNSLFRISLNKLSNTNSKLNVYVKSVLNGKGEYFELSDMVFKPGEEVVYFNIIAPNYIKERSTQYQYMVEGMMTGWSNWTTSPTIVLPAEPGDFTLHVKAKDIWDNESEESIVKYTIKPPFTESTLFFLIIMTIALIAVLMIIKIRESKLQHDNKILEAKVAERTAEIEAQKKEITSSIQYASRIQMAMLPEDIHFKNSFSESFIIFKPRDIVSGDFYWINEDSDRIYFAIADCTGHGVPGAFMSMLGISALQEITSYGSDLKANAILEILREKIINALHQTGKEGEATDGMDAALCILNKKNKMLEFAGAYLPIYVFKNGQFNEYKADRMPIGIYHGHKIGFTNNEIPLSDGDSIYFLTDGFIDQFGGPGGTKFKRTNLKILLSEIASKPFFEQKKILLSQFDEWKGQLNQVDDVTVIGLKI